ncbi:MAG: GNAT family N-acetyltransferase [Anaerolineae bacterium]|nr:GNAT family N-acetyltransferase [Anaerolineae bacterium]
MVAAAVGRRVEGIVPFDPFRHLAGVVELMLHAFRGGLGPGARYTLRRMKRAARWGAWGFWLWGIEPQAGSAPGFVWVDAGHVVGNVSLRRAASPGGWMIGNVAVHADWQGRGIGRALLEKALETAAQQGAAWIGLEVDEKSAVARRMYERTGFVPVGAMLELVHSAAASLPPPSRAPLDLRPGRAADSAALYQLAQEGLSRAHCETLEIRRSIYRAGWEVQLGGWLEGCRESWEICERDGAVIGALRVQSRWFPRWHNLEVLARETELERLGPQLAAAGLSILAHRRPWETTTALPGCREALEPHFTACGFRRLRRLVQMRRYLGQKVTVR